MVVLKVGGAPTVFQMLPVAVLFTEALSSPVSLLGLYPSYR